MGLFLWATSLQESRRGQLMQPFTPRAPVPSAGLTSWGRMGTEWLQSH